jgi:hypothetical protein
MKNAMARAREKEVEILQIMPAPGWRAYSYTRREGSDDTFCDSFREIPVVGWALFRFNPYTCVRLLIHLEDERGDVWTIHEAAEIRKGIYRAVGPNEKVDERFENSLKAEMSCNWVLTFDSQSIPR